MESLLLGFDVALSPVNLLYVFIGVTVGMLIGILPGLGPAPTVALMLPLTYTLSPETAIIMLAGIYYGSMYGGTITAVLLKIPGEASSVVTAIDGNALAKKGKAGKALGVAAICSFLGGTFALIGLTLFAAPIASFALGFGPPEYAALTFLGLIMAAFVGAGSFARSFIAVCIGLLLATIGQDPIEGAGRFTLGITELFSGLNLVVVAIGLFGIGEVLYNLEGELRRSEYVPTSFKDMLPTRSEARRIAPTVARGGFIGFIIGILPGGGGAVSSMTAYAMEKRIQKGKADIGNGAIEGVAAPETANNASSSAAFIPLLTLGIPPSPVLALIFGALVMQGITPGPGLVASQPELFWGVIASMYVGNVLLLIMALPLVGVFARIVKVRMSVLGPIALVLSLVGAYSINNSITDVGFVIGFGVLGYLLRKVGFETAPIVLGFVLGSIFEMSVRQSLLISGGDPSIFITRPVAGVITVSVVLMLLYFGFRALLRQRDRQMTRTMRGEEANPQYDVPTANDFIPVEVFTGTRPLEGGHRSDGDDRITGEPGDHHSPKRE